MAHLLLYTGIAGLYLSRKRGVFERAKSESDGLTIVTMDDDLGPQA